MAALAVGLLPGAASAAPAPAPVPPAPRTAADAKAQLVEFNEQFETITERYNDARIMLRRRQAEARVTDARSRGVQARYAAVSAQIGRVVSASYRGAPFGPFASALSSSSPKDFVDQLSALDMVARRRGALLAEVDRLRVQAQRTAQQARAAVTVAQRLARETAWRRADLARRAAQSRALFERLSAQERRAFLSEGGHGVPGDRATRSTTRPPTNVNATGKAKIAVDTALAQLGKPYEWAAAGPRRFDCSGLTMYAYAAAGYSLPHSSRMQYDGGTKVARSALEPGDLVFFYSPIRHVGSTSVGTGWCMLRPSMTWSRSPT